MTGWTQAITTGITAFAATNIDDIVTLMLLFAQVNSGFRPHQIVAGQYLGFTVLILASLPGFLGGIFIPQPWIGLLGFLPIGIGLHYLLQQHQQEPEVQAIAIDVEPTSRSRWFSTLQHLLTPEVYYVAAITVANGGDNIGIYIPLFASSRLATLGIILGTFWIMVGIWCVIAYQLTRHPLIAKFCTRYGHAIVPFFLMGLGIWILWDSESYQLLRGIQ